MAGGSAEIVTSIVERLHKLTRKHIMVVGDVMVDQWVHGYVAQCQDDCPKFVWQSVIEVPGGAANAERSLSKWDVKTWLYGFAHNDCPIKTRYVENGKIVFRADDDGHTVSHSFTAPPKRESYQWARDLAMEMVNQADAVLLSDYDKGFMTPEFIAQVVCVCKKRGIPCVADCKRNMRIYDGCILKGNAAYWGSYPIPSSGVGTYGPDKPVVGPDIVGLDLPHVECVNHVGAGDCFAAHLTFALAHGFSLKEAAILAHSAGRVYVQHPHNRPPLPAEIIADLATAK